MSVAKGSKVYAEYKRKLRNGYYRDYYLRRSKTDPDYLEKRRAAARAFARKKREEIKSNVEPR
jgi:hypothetical protein